MRVRIPVNGIAFENGVFPACIMWSVASVSRPVKHSSVVKVGKDDERRTAIYVRYQVIFTRSMREVHKISA
jgi:hypothetical protein